MSQENVEIVRQFYFEPSLNLAAAVEDEDFVRKRLASLRPLADEGFEAVFDPALASAFGDFSPARPGLGGLNDAWLEWLSTWESYYIEPHDFVVVDSERVLVTNTVRGRSKGAQVEVEIEAGSAWTVRDGKAVRVEQFFDLERAKEAAGLRE